MPKRSNTQEFIEKARQIHGDKYDYSNVDYVNNRSKVCIVCPEHGEFWQIPDAHLRGCGCPVCRYISSSSKVRMDVDTFKQRASVVHNNKYDYSNVMYKNTDTPVNISCPIHGEFWQTPHHHLAGIGCPKCGHNSLDTDIFIQRAKEKHGNKYDYSKTKFVDKYTKVTITCPIHGDFYQLPQNHLAGRGCPQCNGSIYEPYNTTIFINKAKEVHGETYKYNNANYVNSKTPVCITCPEHGDFWQAPDMHLQGAGCPECAKRFNKTEKKVLEILESVFDVVSYQYKPTWLKTNNGQQSLDYFLPDYNIGIEYQGSMHFRPNYKFGGEAGYKYTVERDHRKFQRCQENGVKLFYITFEKNTPENYWAPIYKNTDDLITAINNYISETRITLNENDIKTIIKEVIKHII